MKKLVCLALTLALLGFAGCSGEAKPDEPMSTTEAERTTTPLPIEPTHPPISMARLATLKAFWDKHRQTMLEFAELLLDKEPLDISIHAEKTDKGDFSVAFYSNTLGENEPVDETLKKAFEAYHALVVKDTDFYSCVSAGEDDEDGTRSVVFTFIEDFQFASIVFVPDRNPHPFMSSAIGEELEEHWCIHIQNPLNVPW